MPCLMNSLYMMCTLVQNDDFRCAVHKRVGCDLGPPCSPKEASRQKQYAVEKSHIFIASGHSCDPWRYCLDPVEVVCQHDQNGAFCPQTQAEKKPMLIISQVSQEKSIQAVLVFSPGINIEIPNWVVACIDTTSITCMALLTQLHAISTLQCSQLTTVCFVKFRKKHLRFLLLLPSRNWVVRVGFAQIWTANPM